MFIILTERMKKQNEEQYAKVISTYNSPVVPRIGEIVDLPEQLPYEVIQVVYTNTDTVLLEVKEYNNTTLLPISQLRCH